MIFPILLVGLLLWLAALAGCNGEALISPPPSETLIPPTVATPTETAPVPSTTPEPTTTHLPPTATAHTQGPSTEAAAPGPAESFPTPPERDYYRLARELIPGVGDIDPVVRLDAPYPRSWPPGNVQTWLIWRIQSNTRANSPCAWLHPMPTGLWRTG